MKIRVIMYLLLRLSCPKFILLTFEAVFQNRVLASEAVNLKLTALDASTLFWNTASKVSNIKLGQDSLKSKYMITLIFSMMETLL